jgi:hypothetical protein
MLKACLFLCVILPVQLFCQTNSNDNFTRSTKAIDLKCKTIDKDTTLVKLHIELSGGGSIGFVAEGYGYYNKMKEELIKFVYKGYEDSITIKTFYYYNKTLIKMLDDEEVYYYIDILRDKNGVALTPELTQKLYDVEGLINGMPASTRKRFLNHL